jgi:hypothetical protein
MHPSSLLQLGTIKKTALKGGGRAKKERIFITNSARERILTDKLNLFCCCQGLGGHL